MNKEILKMLMASFKKEDVEEMLNELIKEYSPLLELLVDKALELKKAYATRQPDFAELEAEIAMNKLTAYIEAGFTRDEAFSLMIQDIVNKKNTREAINKITDTISKSAENQKVEWA